MHNDNSTTGRAVSSDQVVHAIFVDVSRRGRQRLSLSALQRLHSGWSTYMIGSKGLAILHINVRAALDRSRVVDRSVGGLSLGEGCSCQRCWYSKDQQEKPDDRTKRTQSKRREDCIFHEMAPLLSASLGEKCTA